MRVRSVIRLGLALAVVVLVAWLLMWAAESGAFGGASAAESGSGTAPGSVTSSAFPAPTADTVAQAKDRLAGLGTGYGGEGGAYHRESFGRGWADLDGDGCLTRNEVLQRDLTGTSLHGNGCVVASGTLLDPYTGETVRFTHGSESSQAVQIDHIVPLAYAWRQGAWRWSAEQRVRFSNDQRNLVAVDGQQNDDKGSDGPGRWMPPNAGVHCGYAVTFVMILNEYGLDAFPADERELSATLARC